MPVINGLTNEYHPCQILADIYTFIEHRGAIKGKTVAWIGDSNNMCNTWLQAAEIFDFKLNVSTPPGYEVERRRIREQLRVLRRPDARGAGRAPRHHRRLDLDGLRGRERGAQEGLRRTGRWTRDMMKAARKDALFMHCLPAHRGEEVAAEVIDGKQSVVWEEAENRLHTQKALMEFLLLGKVKD